MLPRSRAAAGLIVALATLGPVPSRAEPAHPAALDQATFLSKVRDRSPHRLVFDERRRAASAHAGVARVRPNPTLGWEREAVPSLDTSDDYIRLGWTLDLAGRRGLAGQAAEAGAEAERHEVTRDEWALVSDARLAYLEAMYARDHVVRLDEARTQLVTLVDTLRSRAKQGDASSYDADRAALELDGLDDDRATARQYLELAQLRLGALIGEPGTAYEASDALALPSAPDATTALAPRRAEVDAANARAAQADRELAAARRAWVPRLELMGGLRVSTSGGSDGVGYVVGLGGELPLFGRGKAASARAAADAKRWRAEAQATTIGARADSELARRELVLRIEQATAYLAGPLVRAADLQRRAAVAYREGDRPILELLDVQRAARHASMRALELIYDARRAELALQRALGGDR